MRHPVAGGNMNVPHHIHVHAAHPAHSSQSSLLIPALVTTSASSFRIYNASTSNSSHSHTGPHNPNPVPPTPLLSPFPSHHYTDQGQNPAEREPSLLLKSVLFSANDFCFFPLDNLVFTTAVIGYRCLFFFLSSCFDFSFPFMFVHSLVTSADKTRSPPTPGWRFSEEDRRKRVETFKYLKKKNFLYLTYIRKWRKALKT